MSHRRRPVAALLVPLLAACVASPLRAMGDDDPVTRAASAHVTIVLGSGDSATFLARGLQLSLARGEGGPRPAARGAAVGAPAVAGQARFVREADGLTSALAAHVASGEHLPTVTIRLLDAGGRATMTIRLLDAAVSSERIIVTEGLAQLEEQRIGRQEAIAQLTTEAQEAQRNLTALETLAKRGAASPLDQAELSRARARATEVQTRLDLARRRLALLESQAAERWPVEEEIALSFGRAEVASTPPTAP